MSEALDEKGEKGCSHRDDMPKERMDGPGTDTMRIAQTYIGSDLINGVPSSQHRDP